MILPHGVGSSVRANLLAYWGNSLLHCTEIGLTREKSEGTPNCLAYIFLSKVFIYLLGQEKQVNRHLIVRTAYGNAFAV